MDVVGGDASITAQELPAILAHSAVLHVVIFFLLLYLLPFLLILFLLLLGFPLHPLLLLGGQMQSDTDRKRRRDRKTRMTES